MGSTRAAGDITIEVVFAAPERQVLQVYRLPVPASVADALGKAASDPAFEGVDVFHSVVGVFGQVRRVDQPLEEGDRVEIYRPLTHDPKSARRQRARDARRR